MRRVHDTSTHTIDVHGDPDVDQTAATIRREKFRELKAKRKEVETSGAYYNEYLIKTDEGSLAKIVSTIMALERDSTKTVNWKSQNGWILNADLTIMKDIADVVSSHINEAFDIEKDVADVIDDTIDEDIAGIDIEALWAEHTPA